MAKKSTSELIDVEGLEITLIRSRRRTLALEVDHRGIRARAPQRLAMKEIVGFIRTKKTWLKTQLNNAPAPPDKLSLTQGSTVPLNGSMLPIQLSSGRGPIFLDHLNEHATLHIPIISSHLSQQETAHRKLSAWYRQTSLIQLEELVAEIIPKMENSISAPQVRVRDYKRRWGSCDHRGNLSFNWRLVMAPREIQRYVVVHELAHRQEFNHSKRFWQIVSYFDPEWRTHQNWLQANGFELYRL